MLAQVFAAVVLAGVLVAAGSLVALHILPTGLSPIADAVSAYGISRYRGLYRAQTIATAVAAAALAIALPSALASDATAAIVCLIVLAVVRAVIGWVPMDAFGSPRTRAGRMHNLLAFAAFAAASVGGFMLGIAFSGDPRFAALAGASSGLGWAMSAASALALLSALIAPLRLIFGFAERLIYLAMLGWLAFAAIALLAV